MDTGEQVPYALGTIKMLRVRATVPQARFLDVIRRPFEGGDNPRRLPSGLPGG